MTAPAVDIKHPDGEFRPRQTAGKGLLVGVVAGSLVAASLLRGYFMNVTSFKPKENNAFVAQTASTDQLDSYTLGLLLGGLRGPLVMTLWSSSETQKSERNLEDINTKIELIRLLQPEFDSVHLFQIWNKAYNLSVQMANLPSKYAMILDAIDYANNTRAGKENINLESAVGGIYFDKLGGASEKAYYRARVRDESQPPRAQVKITFPSSRRDEFIRAALAAGAEPRRYTLRPEAVANGVQMISARLRDDIADATLKGFTGNDIATERFAARAITGPTQTTVRSRLDPVLDADGNLLEKSVDGRLLTSKDRPADLDDTKWTPEYGELQYLTRFQPFKRGVSPYAFAFNYYKRATALQVSKNQTHSQLSDRVISSRMTLALKSWAEEDVELGRYAELAHFGKQPLPEEQSPLPLETPAGDVPTAYQPRTPLLDEAIYDYERAAQIAAAGNAELRGHLARYADDFGTYGNLKADLAIKGALAQADADYLKLIVSNDEAERARLAKSSADAYVRAIELTQRIILAYYVQDEIITATFPQGYGKIDVINSFDDPRTFPTEYIRPALAIAVRIMMQQNALSSEIGEYATYMARADARLAKLEPLVGQRFVPSANLTDLPAATPGSSLLTPPGLTPSAPATTAPAGPLILR